MRNRNFLVLILLVAANYGLIAQDSKYNIEEMTEAERQAFISGIEFVEIEAEPVLGFEVLKYLPNDFDAYKGMIFNMKEIHFEEVQNDIEVKLEKERYLPNTINPFVGQ